MAHRLFSRVALTVDLPEHHLQAGDVATIVDTHEAKGRTGYSLEVFNATGETINVVVVEESQIEPLRNDEVFHIRRIAV
jgi:hypothetical protein